MAARALAVCRIGLGVSLSVAPRLAASWAGDDVRGTGGQLLARTLAGRDIALGAGTLAAAAETARLRQWLIACSASDAADFAASLPGPRSPARALVLAFAGAAAVANAAAAAKL